MNIKTLCSLALAALVPSLAFAAAKPSLKLVAENLVSPTTLVPIDGGRCLVADQLGQIYLLNKEGKLAEKPVLDLSARMANYNTNAFDERGLCGLAVHPKFSANRKFYAYYSAPLRTTAPTNFNHTARLAEFTLAADNTAGNGRTLLEIDMPAFNHHSGRMAFGPDGLLYLSVGDGGGGNDVGIGHSPQGNGQDTSKLLGKVLRLDVDKKDAGKEYAVPKSNPFVKGGGLPEIFAYGFRNPWGLSFDRGTGWWIFRSTRELFLADVGQDSWEEINIIKKGGNYGWNVREGFACFNPKDARKPPEECPKVGANGEPLIDPIVAYKNFRKFTKDPDAKGISITGGYVYRGKAFPELTGQYIFGDWSRNFVKADGVIYAAKKGADGQWTMTALELAGKPDGAIGQFILAFGEDADGELYLLTNTTSALRGKNGKVWKLAAD